LLRLRAAVFRTDSPLGDDGWQEYCMRRLILSTAFAIALVAIATDGFSQQPPPAPPPAPALPGAVQVFEYKQGLTPPAAAPQVIEFTGKINGDLNSKDGRQAIRFAQPGNGGNGGSFIIQSTLGSLMGQGRGGPGGGGFGGGMPGGMRMTGGDPNQMFNMLSQGKEVINRNDLPAWQQQMFDRFAPQMGITNGQITRSQFQQAAETMRSRMQGGGGPGGPGGGFGGQGGGMSPEQMDRFSEERFRRADTNGDGLLQVNEMSERLRPVWEKFDTNRDGAIDLNEFKSYMRSVFQENSSNTPAAQPPAAQPQGPLVPDSGSASAEDDDRRPTVYRAGKLPKDIPAWFEQLDTDKDGQVGLYEWVNADRSIDEFRAMDRNEDGFLTIDEVMAYVRAKSNNSQGDSLAMANPINGFNGFGFGGGMQFNDNAQDNRGRPGRNRGGENGRGPGGMGRGPNGGNNGNGRPDNNWFKGRGGDNSNGGNGNGFFGGFGGPGGRRGGDGNGFGGGGPGGRRGGDNASGRPDYTPNSPPAGGNNSGYNGPGRNNRRNPDGE
jgi:Ca2+-binding EF-hand superfamily protein